MVRGDGVEQRCQVRPRRGQLLGRGGEIGGVGTRPGYRDVVQ